MSARGLTFLLVALALALAGCGGDDEGEQIPRATANALDAELDGVQDRLDNGSAGACRDILEGPRGPNRARVEQIIDSIPDDVDADIRSALADSFDRLWDLVGQECEDRAQEEEAQQEPEPEPEPEPTQTETTETETTETETDTTETVPPAEEELPPEGDGDNDGGVPGNGNGNGNGVGNGGGVGPGGADLGGGG
jgi:hypothetical protein